MRRAYMMALGVATQTWADSVDNYVTGLQEQSNQVDHARNVREFPTDSKLTERNSLVANAAASEGDNSFKLIDIGFLEESPRVNLRNGERFINQC